MSAETRIYERFPLARRIEHIVMLTSFGMLALTGLPQKFPTWRLSVAIATLFGSIENLRLVHHLSATAMMLGAAYHILLMGYKVYVLREHMTMMPSFQDARDALQSLLYNLGIGKSRPQMGRFSFEEKTEYWAFVWGAIIMGLTGFMMWNPLSTSLILPGEFIPAAKAAHGGEAILAVLAIILWHFYGVHIKFFNKAMWTGHLTEEEMLHEHPLELANMKAGERQRTTDPVKLKQRQKIYFPVAAVLTLIMLSAIYGFLTIENTSPITTILPGENAPIYSHRTPTPAPTQPAAPTASAPLALTWNDFAGPLFAQKCTACHGAAAVGGLNLSTFADALKGGSSGLVIVPNDSANSKLIQLQQAGGHPGQLSAEEIAQISAWIDAGAPEK
jgi:cytochrome b subunit of formate dehydrogenase/mono/diheme cytochrome c family protein